MNTGAQVIEPAASIMEAVAHTEQCGGCGAFVPLADVVLVEHGVSCGVCAGLTTETE